jgi:hypothetical protein
MLQLHQTIGMTNARGSAHSRCWYGRIRPVFQPEIDGGLLLADASGPQPLDQNPQSVLL